MNAEDLAANPALQDWAVADLNTSPSLPMHADSTLDAVFCSVSVDYPSKPRQVFAELHRVLKPGGLAVFTWSNRMRGSPSRPGRRRRSPAACLWICGAYFHFTPGFGAPVGVDISPNPGRTDPLYAVYARKVDVGDESAAAAEPACDAPESAQK